MKLVEELKTIANCAKFVTALTDTELLGTLTDAVPLTIFAPTNAAFDNGPAELRELLKSENKGKLASVLKAHIISATLASATFSAINLPNQLSTLLSGTKVIVDKNGNSIKVNGATVAGPEIQAENGLIYVIDKFLMPLKDGVETLTSAGTFKNFTVMLTAADLLGLLKSDSLFTAFAPTDAAFAKLAPVVLTELQKVENKALLTKLLKHHITAQLMTSASINRLPPSVDIPMLNGLTAKLSRTGSVININNAATVNATDMFSINGMIQAIDTVLLPPMDMVEATIMNGKFTTLLSALGKADLISTLKGAGPFTLFAPNDDAFAKLSKTELADLLKSENKDKLASILKYHVVSGKSILKSELKQGQQFGVLAGGNITVSINGTKTKINEATIIEPNGVSSDNGVIYTIDTVLTPKTNVASTTYAYQASLGFLLSTLVFLYHACL